MGEPLVWTSLEGQKAKTPWLWNETFDSLVIGGAGSLVFAAVALLGSLMWGGFGPAIVVVFLHLGLAVNYPHYAATYQIVVRERKKAPRSFRFLMLSLPVVLFVTLAAAFHEKTLLPPLLRLYISWSPYDYAAQHFGIASMYCARKGRPLVDDEKRLLKVGFVGVALFLILTLNASSLDPRASGQGPMMLSPILPEWTYLIALASAAVGIGASVLSYSKVRSRTGQGWDRMVTILLVANFVWFVVPNVWIPGMPKGPWVGPRLGLWIPLAIPFFHCAQYLGMTTHRTRTTGPVRPVYLLILLMIVGYGVFEVTAMGLEHGVKMTQDASLLLMVSVVNVHHFWLDGIVWKGPPKKSVVAATTADAAGASPTTG